MANKQVFVAAKRDGVQFGDDDDVFNLILILQGDTGMFWQIRGP
jgi:hypothetical protein